MKILLVNVDSKIPNVALQKLQFYYERKGSKVVVIKDDSVGILPFIDGYDKVYVSCIFDYNKRFCKKWEGLAIIGGSGYSITKKLPLEIEQVKPRKNIGFTMRGCLRNCPWCIVQQKEGQCRITGDIYDIWDGQAKNITLLDNNILGVPKQFFKIAGQIKKENLQVDFNSGFDHHLLTNEICQEIFTLQYCADWGGSKKPSTAKIRFAFDHISYKKSVLRALKMLQRHGLKKWQTRWYIYVGTSDTVKSVLERINILRNAKQLVFVMLDRDSKVQNNLEFKKIYAWTCHVSAYAAQPYYQYRKQFSKINDDRPNLFNQKI